jgi:hypothetical protein
VLSTSLDLARCFGLETWNAATSTFEATEDRTMTDRERELLEETEFTRPVDFHSWRRRFVQALADMGMNAQQAQKLAGHADLSAHERYLRTTSKTLVIPEAALPQLEVSWQPATIALPSDSQPSKKTSTPGRTRTCDQWVRKQFQ